MPNLFIVVTAVAAIAEVKTGVADLNENERTVKGAILERRVEWSPFRIPNGQPQMPDWEPHVSADARAGAPKDDQQPHRPGRSTHELGIRRRSTSTAGA